MNSKSVWNSAAKWGFILGVVMSCSKIFEQRVLLSGEVSQFALLALEWIFVAILLGAILRKAIKERLVDLKNDGVELRYNQGVNYAIIVSIFASILVSGSYFIYVKSIVGGFDVYAHTLVESMTKVISEVEITPEIRAIYANYFNQIENSELTNVSIFDIAINTMSTYIIVGALYGLVITIFVKRKLKCEGKASNEQNSNE